MKCKINNKILLKNDGALYHKEEHWYNYDLKEGEIYEIYAFGINEQRMKFLLDESNEVKPWWYSSDAFIVVDGCIRDEWMYREYSNHRGWMFIAGYPELIEIASHHEGLMERNRLDIEMFHDVKNRYGV